MIRSLIALIAALVALPCSAQVATAELIRDLHNGGFVIYFKHGETGSAVSDRAQAVIGDCSTQRNLNDTGRRQVAQLGEDFKALRIPVGAVLSSEFCRCWQHAQAMFGKRGYATTVKLNAPLSYPEVSEADRALNNENLRSMLAKAPAAGRNTVLVAHGVNVLLLTGFHPNVQGEAVIFRPDGNGGFERIASVLPDQWRQVRQSSGTH